MPWLIALALDWKWPSWAAKLFGWLLPPLLIAAALWGTYALIYHKGETAGGAKVTAKVEAQHTKTVAEAHADSKTAQDVTDRIGDRVTRADAATTELVRSKIEDMQNAIDATPVGPAAAPVDTGSLSASLDSLVDRANRAADAADAQP